MIDRRNVLMLGAGMAAAGLTGLGKASAATRSTIGGVNLGIQSYTFGRDPIDEAISGISQSGFGQVEIHPFNLEPQFSGLTQEGNNRIKRPPGYKLNAAEVIIAKNSREMQHNWRLNVPLDYYRDTKRKFNEVGVEISSYSFHYFNITDEEIEASLDATLALGTDIMTAVTPIELLPKLDQFAKAKKVRIAVHNSFGMNSIATFENAVKGLSDYTGFCLDVGHFFAGGQDPIPMLQKHRSRIFCTHIKDRKMNNGPPMLLGEGDTPVVQVLRWMRDNRFTQPASVEQEVDGWNRLEIAKHDLEYCRRALAN